MAITWDDINVRVDRISKKDWYIYLSLVVCAFLVGAAINDVVHLKLTQRTEYTTNKFTMALLVSFSKTKQMIVNVSKVVLCRSRGDSRPIPGHGIGMTLAT